MEVNTEDGQAPKKKPRLDVVASANPPIPSKCNVEYSCDPRLSKPFFKSVEWSSDGTSVIASSSQNQIYTYVLPQDLLEPRQDPFQLSAQGILNLPEPTRAIAPCPYFTLGYQSTQTVLVGCKDHPLQLFSLLPEISPTSSPAPPPLSPPPAQPAVWSPAQRPLASYRFIKPQTEGYITASSLLWPSRPGTHFVAGAANAIAYFDASRAGEGPVLAIPTIPSARHVAKGSGVGMKGTVAALAAQPSSADGGHASALGLVAAGTWTSWVGIYDFGRAGECVATWALAADRAGHTGVGGGGGGGGGVVQALWSPCGRYLILNERRDTGLVVYDVRVTGRLLARLAGRGGVDVNQRLSCDVFPSSAAADGLFEVWAGTPDGRVLVWDRVGSAQGVVEPTWDWDAYDSASAVGATALHPGGSVLATCAGSYPEPEDDSDDDSDSDEESRSCETESSDLQGTDGRLLKIWSITAAAEE